MNPHLVKRAIRAFVRAHQDDLVDGLKAGTTDKKIAQVTTSRHTPVRRGICIFIATLDGREYFDSTRLGTSQSYSRLVASIAPQDEYNVQMHIMDYAMRRSGEDVGGDYEFFETDDETFWTFVSRLVNAFRDNATIPPESGSWTIEVQVDGSEEDAEIRVRDLSESFEDGQGNTHAELYAIIDFRVKTCGEPDPL